MYFPVDQFSQLFYKHLSFNMFSCGSSVITLEFNSNILWPRRTWGCCDAATCSADSIIYRSDKELDYIYVQELNYEVKSP